jgi:hypothetical protein
MIGQEKNTMRSRYVRKLFLALVVLAISSAAVAQIRISVGFGPPALPVYEQPVCPGDGYLWTPGYWAWDGNEYYWVPGTWVESPEVGYLWTPPYWGWEGGSFLFHEGYWGPHVGFYGGISYGFGYFGAGFVGGRWDGGHFFYNRSVVNVNVVNVHNVYNETIVNRTVINHVSYNGGEGGITARPTPQEEEAGRDRHIEAVAAQRSHVEEARNNPDFRASVNHGKPTIAATARPGEFKGNGAVAAREAGGEYHAPAGHPEAGHPEAGHPEAGHPEAARPEAGRPSTYGHVKELPPAEHAPAPNTGNANLDKRYQGENDKLAAKQDKERQTLAARQEKEDQRNTKAANTAHTQQTEQRHQQQTQQLQQRHQQQQQAMQQRHTPPPAHSGGKPK